MGDDEFKKLVLEKLGTLDQISKDIKEIKHTLKSFEDNIFMLNEFRTEVNSKLDDIKEDVSKMDILTAKNNLDIAKLKTVK